jgi:hypothetical protein
VVAVAELLLLNPEMLDDLLVVMVLVVVAFGGVVETLADLALQYHHLEHLLDMEEILVEQMRQEVIPMDGVEEVVVPQALVEMLMVVVQEVLVVLVYHLALLEVPYTML